VSIVRRDRRVEDPELFPCSVFVISEFILVGKRIGEELAD
jgi:hypothetical protein